MKDTNPGKNKGEHLGSKTNYGIRGTNFLRKIVKSTETTVA